MCIRDSYATVCVLGVNGISAEDGITTSLYQETEINDAMLNRCRGKRIVAADSSKVGRTLNFISAPIDKIDMLVTTARADPAEIEKLKARGVEVLLSLRHICVLLKGVGCHRHEGDGCGVGARKRADFLRGGDTVHDRHTDIHQNNAVIARCRRLKSIDSFLAVAGFVNGQPLHFQQRARNFHIDLVVLH